jgi:hypothetical protein
MHRLAIFIRAPRLAQPCDDGGSDNLNFARLLFVCHREPNPDAPERK